MAIYKRAKSWHMDVMINGVRYREALDTTDRREASALEKKRVAEIQAGKGASKAGRAFARLPFGAAADTFAEDRKTHISARTHQLDRERLKPLRVYFGDRPLLRIRAEDIAAYQRARLAGTLAVGDDKRRQGRTRVGPRTTNIEVMLLRQMLRRAKTWNIVAEDVRMLPESGRVVAKVLTREQKQHLFRTAASSDGWLVAYCAAVLAASTTCRSVELKGLHWRDVDLFGRVMDIRRSKTEAGHRTIPLNSDALAAFARLRARAEAFNGAGPDHFVFPSCERGRLDLTRHQETWRTAWRSLVRTAATSAGREAAQAALGTGARLSVAVAAYREAAEPFRGSDSMICGIRRSLNFPRLESRTLPSWRWPGTCRVRCWSTTATCVWLPSAQRSPSWKAA